jgi:phosphoribosylglycinamide formyltransferase-1
MKKKIAIFASGSGTNAEKIMSHFQDHELGEVAMVLSNKPDAFVLERARKFNVPAHVFDRERFYNSTEILDLMIDAGISLIVLAGFLWLVPADLIRAFPNRMINIHPALLPKYGGKGMYGRYVHEAVINNKEKESGISIHYVNEVYDDGKIIRQEKCEVKPDDTPESLAQRIHLLEHRYYPLVIEELLQGLDWPPGSLNREKKSDPAP